MSKHIVDWETGFVLVVSPEGLSEVPFRMPVIDSREKLKAYFTPIRYQERPLLTHKGYSYGYDPYGKDLTRSEGHLIVVSKIKTLWEKVLAFIKKYSYIYPIKR